MANEEERTLAVLRDSHTRLMAGNGILVCGTPLSI